MVRTITRRRSGVVLVVGLLEHFGNAVACVPGAAGQAAFVGQGLDE
jgi:hypothetical protein